MAMQHIDTRRNTRNRLYNAPRGREKHNWACYVLVLVIFIGTFAQIFSLAQLMYQNKQIAFAYTTLHALEQQEKNARNALIQHTNPVAIQKRAEALGMITAENSEIRRVPVHMAAYESDTNAQTAYSGGNQ